MGFYLLFLAARWLLVTAYCSPLPFWDDWLDTVHYLRDIKAGNVEWAKYLEPYNGHRKLTQRVVAAAVFLANDQQWDAQVQTTFNALFAGLIPLVLLGTLCTVRRDPSQALTVNPAGLVAAFLVWGLPVLWYNSIWAIQLHAYFLVLFSIGGILATFLNRCWSMSWWGGIVMQLLAIFSTGSGFLVSAAIFGTCLLAFLRERKSFRELWPSLIASLILVAAGLFLIHGTTTARTVGAQGLAELAGAMARNFSWPWMFEPFLANTNFVGLLLSVPAPVFLMLWLFRGRRLESTGLNEAQARGFCALILWSGTQLLLMSYARGLGGEGGSLRHYDLHAVWIFVNCACLIQLYRGFGAGPAVRAKVLLRGACVAYAALLAGGIAKQCVLSAGLMEFRRDMNTVQEETVRAYLATGDKGLFENRRYLETPFTALDDPGALLDDPVVRQILPSRVREPLALTPRHDLNATRAYIRGPMPPFETTPVHQNLWISWRPWLETTDRLPWNEVGKGAWTLSASPFPYLGFRYFAEFHGPHQPVAVLSSTSGSGEKADLGDARSFVWQDALIRNSSGGTALRVTETHPKSWMALTEPVEVGRLTVWTARWRNAYPLLVVLGCALMMGGYFWAPAPVVRETQRD